MVEDQKDYTVDYPDVIDEEKEYLCIRRLKALLEYAESDFAEGHFPKDLKRVYEFQLRKLEIARELKRRKADYDKLKTFVDARASLLPRRPAMRRFVESRVSGRIGVSLIENIQEESSKSTSGELLKNSKKVNHKDRTHELERLLGETQRVIDSLSAELEEIKVEEKAILEPSKDEQESIREAGKIIRQEMNCPNIGLALAGGGIRSATFNLGLLQSLSESGILPWVDYLSTVSGGGYIGANLSALLSTHVHGTDPPYDPCEEKSCPESSRDFVFNTSSRFPYSPNSSVFEKEIKDLDDLQSAVQANPDQQTNDSRERHNNLLDHLRTSGNFIIPRLGIFSRDMLRPLGVVLQGIAYTLIVSVVSLIVLASAHYFLAGLMAPGIAADAIVITQDAGQVERSAEITITLDQIGYPLFYERDSSNITGYRLPLDKYLPAAGVGFIVNLIACVVWREVSLGKAKSKMRQTGKSPKLNEKTTLGLFGWGSLIALVTTFSVLRLLNQDYTAVQIYWLWVPPLYILGSALALFVVYLWATHDVVDSFAYRSLFAAYQGLHLYGLILSILVLILAVPHYFVVKVPETQLAITGGTAAVSAIWAYFLSTAKKGKEGLGDKPPKLSFGTVKILLNALVGVFVVFSVFFLQSLFETFDTGGQIATSVSVLTAPLLVPEWWLVNLFVILLSNLSTLVPEAETARAMLTMLTLVVGRQTRQWLKMSSLIVLYVVYAVFYARGVLPLHSLPFWVLFIPGVSILLLGVRKYWLYRKLLTTTFIISDLLLMGAPLLILAASSKLPIAKSVYDAVHIGVVSFLLLLLVSHVSANKVSLHYFYRDKLADAFLSVKVDEKERFDKRDIPLRQINPDGCSAPYHLIVTALNLPGHRDLRNKDRKSAHFVFSRHYCGFSKRSPAYHPQGDKLTGYVKTELYRFGKTKLARAMAISGAAASPTFGMYTFFGQAFMMTMLNVRLGMWMENPRVYDDSRDENSFRKVLTGLLAERSAMWSKYLLEEALGTSDLDLSLVNLSDGAHTGDNIGLYPLLRRRCKLIIAGDAGTDPNYDATDLARVIRQIYIDEGIRVDIQLNDLYPDEKGYSKRHFVIGKITYPDKPEPGYLIYVKPTITPELPADILSYWRTHRSSQFPQQTIADQFFDDDQFESYRHLGEICAQNAIECLKLEGKRLSPQREQVFEHLREEYAKAHKTRRKSTAPTG